MSIVEGLTFVSEREPGPWICCAPASAAMVVGAHLGQNVTLSGHAHDIRKAADPAETHNPPDGSPGGMKKSQVATGIKNEYGLEVVTIPHAKGDVRDALEDGLALIAQLDYGELPSHLRRWSPAFAGGHSVALAGVNSAGKVGWFDPLGTAGWSGEWVELDDVWPAFWDAGFDGLQRKGTGDVPGVKLTMTGPYDGLAVVKPSGAPWVVVATGQPGNAAGGFGPKQVYAKAVLTEPYTIGDTVVPAGTPVVVIGDDMAFFLEQDVELTPTNVYRPVGQLFVREEG